MAPFDASTKIIVLMGSTGTGKTTFINTLAPHAKFVVGHSLRSCTKDIQHVRVRLNGKDVVLVDTQGFDDTDVTISDVDVLVEISKWLTENYSASHRVSGIIYLHRISDNRIGGTSFRQLQMFRRLCGEDAFSNVVLATTMWSNVSDQEGKSREDELCDGLELWKALIDKGAGLKRFKDSHESAMEIVSHLLDVKPTVLQIQAELVEQLEDLKSTKAGVEVRVRLTELRGVLQKQISATDGDLKTCQSRAEIKAGRKEIDKLKRLVSDVDKQLDKLETNTWFQKFLGIFHWR